MRIQTRIHILGRTIGRGIPCLTLILMSLASTFARAQDGSEQFQDLIANASSARDQGDIPRAIGLYQQAVQLDPKWSEGWWYIGSMQYRANNYAPARIALTHYIDLTPSAGPAFALRGLCEFEEEEYPESLQDLQHGIALGAANQPRNAGIILYHEAILLTKMGNFEQALSRYTEMVKHGNVNQDVLVAIGLAGLRLPMFPKDVEPSQMETVSTVGQAAAVFMGGDQSAADHAFRSLFDRYPTVPNLHLLYGYLLFAVDSDKAVDQFKQELAVFPKSAMTHSMLAWSFGLREDYTLSLPQAQEAAEEDPNLLLAQLVLGRALMETGDISGGVQHLLTVLAADPQNLDAHLALAKAYSKLGKREDARRERLQCLAITGQRATSNATM
jgi:tetratricopeptide (TPR) repeat protein